VRIGRGVLHRAIFMIVKSACVVAATDEQIQKAIREGLNTIRLHDRETRNRRLRLQQRKKALTIPMIHSQSLLTHQMHKMTMKIRNQMIDWVPTSP